MKKHTIRRFKALSGKMKDQVGTFCGMVGYGSEEKLIRIEFENGYLADFHPSKVIETT